MRLALVLLALAACQPEDKNFPRVPGGGGGGGGTDPGDNPIDDAGVDGAGVIGRVCLVSDLRRLDQCALETGELTVTLGTQTTTTALDGTFTITSPTSTSNTWRVSGETVIPSVMDFSTINLIPAIRTADYLNLLDANGILPSPGQGSLVIHVADAAGPVVGATVTTIPASQFPPRYDGTSAVVWDTDVTGPFAAAWITGAVAGPTAVTVTSADAVSQSATLGVEGDAITFATIGL